jgi:cyclopropane-fatty-acyl-phospholipid synthase
VNLAQAPTPDATGAAATTLDVLRMLFRDEFARDFAVELWDGTRIPARDDQRFALRVLSPSGLRAALSPPLDLSPGRAFVERSIDMSGDLEAAVDTFERASRTLSRATLALLATRVLRLPRPAAVKPRGDAHLHGVLHSRNRDAAAVGFHYDQPLAFYAAFLDPNLVYSCAYFESDDMTLEQAQIAKIDYLLRKLRLRPGERLLDIGCGWGALVMRAAERFGAETLGVTLSRSQFEQAQRRISSRGLGGRASVELRDYRDLGDRTFDKIVSVGMVEHVGRAKMPEYFEAAFRALRSGGLFVNHGIADQEPGRAGFRAAGFIGRYVFPDGELVSISDSLQYAEAVGFEVRDVENLREHYARTLRHWVANLERNAASAIDAAGEQAYRVWRLYMAGSAQGFRSGRMGLFQSLLAKPHADGEVDLPRTRSDLYIS